MILVIDDQPFYIKAYVEDLRYAGYDVAIERQPDRAVDFFGHNKEEVELVILDVLMPPGKFLQGVETSAGLRAGEHVYVWLRQRAANLPVIILTNVSADIDSRFAGEQNCWVFHKDSCLPHELVHQVNAILRKNEAGEGR